MAWSGRFADANSIDNHVRNFPVTASRMTSHVTLVQRMDVGSPPKADHNGVGDALLNGKTMQKLELTI